MELFLLRTTASALPPAPFLALPRLLLLLLVPHLGGHDAGT
jgi:hypothetical protein